MDKRKKVNRLLTIDDLYDFYSTKKKSMTFSADKSGYNIAVQVNGKFTTQKDDNSEGLLYGKIKAFHDLGNKNKSFIDTEVFEKYIPSMKDRPVMADIIDVEDEDGNIVKDFNGHSMEYDSDNDKIIYIETPVGHFINPDNFEIVYDEEYDRNFVLADCVIYEEYTDTCDILRRRQEVDVSVELCIRDLSFDCKTGELHINNFYVQGCTLLGSHVQPGMAGSKLSLKDFSEENNSVFSNLSSKEVSNTKLIETLEALNSTLSKFNINQAESADNISKEGGNQKLTKFEELLQKYNKTEADIEFETEGLSDEELESKFAEEFGEESKKSTTSDDGSTGETGEGSEGQTQEPTQDPEQEPGAGAGAGAEGEGGAEAGGETTEEESLEIIEKSMEVDGKKFSVSFELSHEDIRYGLYNLIAQYEELDNEWYSIRAVYDDHFAFQGWFTDKIYGQKYTKDGDTVALDGERYELYEELLTASEKAELDSMRSNYSSIQKELNTYKEAELCAKREEVFNDPAYAEFVETDGFKKIKENINTYSVEDLKTACELQFAKEVKAKGMFSFTEKKEEKSKAQAFAFGKIEQKSSFLDGLLNQKKTK